MRIAIGAYPLAGRFTGIGVYIYNIIKHLNVIDKENEYFLYTYHNLQLALNFNPHWHTRIIKGFLNRSSTFWQQTQSRKDLARDKIDLFWATNAIVSLNLPISIKTLLTVHDLTWIYYPKTLRWDNRIIFPLFFKRSLSKTDRIIAVSQCTANALRALFPFIDKKIETIYYGGVGDKFKPIDKMEAKNYISSKFKTSVKYILTVVTIEPRKNLSNLLKAYKILKVGNPQFDYQLLIAGGKGWRNKEIYQTYRVSGFSEKQVKFLEYISYGSEDMLKLYAGAEVFIFPSFYEGFGLPPLEAMACGTPVIASDIPVFREILDDAALLVDPYNPEEIGNAIHRVLADTRLAEELIQKGLERVKMFSWEKTARGTLEAFEKAKNNLRYP